MAAPAKMSYATAQIPRWLLVISGALALLYFTWWLDFSKAESWVLFGLLFVGEIYHVWQALGYIHTIWDQTPVPERKGTRTPPVDVFITVCGEPVDIVEKTVKAAVAMDYPFFTVYVLNDGLVAKKSNWKDIEEMALRCGAKVITRTVPGGAKAGNVNNALRSTSAEFFALFDADHVPHPDFLAKTMPHMEEERMAFVQTPQYYVNKDVNALTQGAWEQQELFFGPICEGKNRFNATFWCGTNAVVRRAAINDIGGVPEDNITEDFIASLFMHQRGWKTLYLPAILAEGLAPTDLKSYFNQQYRWARGSLEAVFRHNPFFARGLTFSQRFQYLYSAGYYLNGIVVAIDALVPLIVLFTGLVPIFDTSGNFMLYFFPFIFSTLYILMRSTNFTITFRAVQLSMSSFFIFILATIATIIGKKSPFKVTSKTVEEGNYLVYALPNIVYVVTALAAIGYAAWTYGPTPAVITNASWALFNIVFFLPFIYVAYPWKQKALEWKHALATFFPTTRRRGTAVATAAVESKRP